MRLKRRGGRPFAESCRVGRQLSIQQQQQQPGIARTEGLFLLGCDAVPCKLVRTRGALAQSRSEHRTAARQIRVVLHAHNCSNEEGGEEGHRVRRGRLGGRSRRAMHAARRGDWGGSRSCLGGCKGSSESGCEGGMAARGASGGAYPARRSGRIKAR